MSASPRLTMQWLVEIEARMLWPAPSSAADRQRFIQSRHADCSIKLLQIFGRGFDVGESAYRFDVLDQVDEVAALARDALPWSTVQKASATPFRQGWVAGSVLRTMVLRDAGGKPMALGKVMALVAAAVPPPVAPRPASQKNAKTGMSVKTVEPIWKKYRSVAHLWAAFLQSVAERGGLAEFPWPDDVDGFRRFFALSNAFRAAGEVLRLPHSRARLLTPGQALGVPALGGEQLMAIDLKGLLPCPDLPKVD